ncbi:hydrogenase maturation protease [Nocardia sp. alder85J]|uniref:hydrogenase maturation protease n=1 Tax=Nocardia sp. alder85J TaxID=2862949 RepID=UPI001CD6A68B|nr:hydrogenase maturation protease [Nocardia sp. alder85J]MCX4098101.1 hydrogenase maturation protease [Nocardia sp. alder85J]
MRVLVAGIGNVFLGDDGFGPAVVRELPPPRAPGVRVTDYGIRGMHLAYDLLDAWDALVLVDALPNRGAPGRVEVLRVDAAAETSAQLDAHAMNPEATFATVRALGGTLPPTTLVVGCQVESITETIGLTDTVAAAVPITVAAVGSVLDDLFARQEV